MINNTKDFDFDLARGVNSEKSISKILGIDADKFEVKSEFGFWQKSGNICIELAYKGKPSGLRATKAKEIYSNNSKSFKRLQEVWTKLKKREDIYVNCGF